MERKTKVHAEDGRQEILVTREFDLPVALLFKAYTDAGLLEQWMGTKVLKLENRNHGSYRFETTDPGGNRHGFSGVIHDVVADRSITRTFEMENSGIGVQLEFLEFENLGNDKSRLSLHMVFRSVEKRDQLLKLPFSWGISMAHDRLQKIATQPK